jgi:hypothetical protein
MGEENSLPTVEESTEPPICAQRSNNHGPPTIRSRPRNARDTEAPASLTNAHTLTVEKVAEELGVDIKYCSPNLG